MEAAREPLAATAGRLFTPLLTKAAAGAALIRLGDPRGEDALRAVLRAFRPDGRPYAVLQVMQLKLAALRPELEALLQPFEQTRRSLFLTNLDGHGPML